MQIGYNHPARDEHRSPLAQAAGLREIDAFGSNPGNLRMFAFVPEQRARPMPLLVVLHGCLQTASGFHQASELGELASEHGFAVLYPQQQQQNNERTCFSWFQPEDVRRGVGEVESIRQMIGWAVTNCDVDEKQVFACGLSAGGAMCGAMLAGYPELFNAGAILAGLPFGCAGTLSEALDAMFVGRVKDAARWGDLVRKASPAPSRWPRIFIWYGTDDEVVRPINAGELVKQWTNVHEIGSTVPQEDQVGPAARRSWRDRQGRACVTTYMIPGLRHGVPIGDIDPPAPFFLPAGISAIRQIIGDFGLTEQASRTQRLRSMIGLRS